MNERQYSDIKKEITTILNSMIDLNETNFNIENTTVHLTTTIIRLKSNNYIPLSYTHTINYKDHPLFETATNICNELASVYTVVFPLNEITYLTMYLANQTILDQELNFALDLLDEQTIELLNKFKLKIEHSYPEYTFKPATIGAFGLHLQQAIIRLVEDKQIDNPLTNEIKSKYPLETNYSELCNEVLFETFNKKLIDSELAFITMHFATKSN